MQSQTLPIEPEPAMPDQSLIENDPEFRALMEVSVRRAKQLVKKHETPDPHASDIVNDVPNDVMLKVAKRYWDRLKGNVRAAGYVVKMTNTAWVDYWRRNGRDPTELLPDGFDVEDNEDPSPSDELLAAFRDCKNKLPADLRRLFEMRFDHKQTFQSIGDQLGVKRDTIVYRSKSILKALRECLEEKKMESIHG
jgi:RNA polymerase sigma factor (sigma-70 family)